MLPWSVMASAFIPKLGGLLDELVDVAGAVEQAELGVQVQVDESSGLSAHSHSMVDGGLLETS